MEKNEDEPQIISLYNNPKMWSFYVDLEINFGNFETAKMAYKKMVEIKVITPYILLNYAQMLEENNFFEESFKVYETGITLFVWPGVYDVWLQYIAKFVSRYQNQKIERTRDLFEKVLVIVPVEVKYSKF
jgi:pre-mRNA-splicing factor SYF1